MATVGIFQGPGYGLWNISRDGDLFVFFTAGVEFAFRERVGHDDQAPPRKRVPAERSRGISTDDEHVPLAFTWDSVPRNFNETRHVLPEQASAGCVTPWQPQADAEDSVFVECPHGGDELLHFVYLAVDRTITSPSYITFHPMKTCKK